MTLTELSERVGVSVVNLSILKNGHARAIRFSRDDRRVHTRNLVHCGLGCGGRL
jgi:hypothetical protein